MNEPGRHVRRPYDSNTGKRKKRRRKKKGVGRFVFLCVLIVGVIAGGFTLFNIITSESYDSKDSFEQYAADKFDSLSDEKAIGKEISKFYYGKPVSVAHNYPRTGNKILDTKIMNDLDTLRANFEGQYDNEEPDKKFAQISSYDSFKSSRNTHSIVLKTLEFAEKTDGSFKIIGSDIKTYNFNSKNKSEVFPSGIFETGYEEKLIKKIKQTLKREIGDDLKANYEELFKGEASFNQFVLADDSLKVYFAAGQVADRAKGIISIELDKDSIKGIVKKIINSRNIDPNKPMVALTYDDGPGEGSSEKILDILEQHNSVATFFELGKNVKYVKGGFDIVRREEKIGCEVASHSWDHPDLFRLTDEKVKEQNDKTDKVLREALGHDVTLYRPPYGNGNDNTTKIFGKAGILWSVDTLDWKSRNAQSVINIVKNTDNLDGRVVLMHSIYDSTADATKVLVPWLKKQGYQLVTVSELLTFKYKEDPSKIKFYGYDYFRPAED